MARLSIVFTTRDDPWLFDALAGLRDVDHAGLDVEVVVVLHGSGDAFVGRVMGAVEALGEPVVVGYLGGGTTIAAARNCGARMASHDTLLFLDSDCVLRPDSLRAVAGNRLRLANGAVDFRSSGSWFSRHNCTVRDVGYRSLRTRLPYMPNLLIDRQLFEEVGGFRTGLPRGEDFEFGDRLVRHGHRPGFLPGLRVTHLDDKRATKTFRNWYRNGWGAAARRLLDPGVGTPSLVTPEQRGRHGPGYAVVSWAGALVLTAGYLAGLATSGGRARSAWSLRPGTVEPEWTRRAP